MEGRGWGEILPGNASENLVVTFHSAMEVSPSGVSGSQEVANSMNGLKGNLGQEKTTLFEINGESSMDAYT